ncbi:MAG: hypothetical protein AB4426_33375 [Xenococcaceae cyanobacterium]
MSPSNTDFPFKAFLAVGVGVPSLFVIMGVIFVLFFGSITELTCRRVEPEQIKCERTEISGGLIALSRTTIPLNQLQGAKIGKGVFKSNQRNSFRESTLYNILLILDGEEVALTNSYSSDYWKKKAIVDQINNFLNDEQENNLTIKEDGRITLFLLGGGFILVGTIVGTIFLAVSRFIR